jgi:hypothetical protein
VVTLLADPPLELPLPDVDVVPEVPVVELDPLLGLLVVVVVAVVVVLLPDAVATIAVLRARAGSCPLTSTIAISNQLARNIATAPATTRRRIWRTRLARRCRISCPRRGPLSALTCVIVRPRFGRGRIEHQ